MASSKSNFNGNEVLAEVCFVEKYQVYEIAGYTVIPLPARHGDEKLGAYIYIIQKGGKSILWAHDTGKFFSETMTFIQNSGIRFDLVSLDCTLQRGHQITASHMDVDWCLEMVGMMRQSGNVDDQTSIVLSHIGHLVQRTHAALQQEVEPFGMTVAYDGMEIEI